jgi:hypothetical protein
MQNDEYRLGIRGVVWGFLFCCFLIGGTISGALLGRAAFGGIIGLIVVGL